MSAFKHQSRLPREVVVFTYGDTQIPTGCGSGQPALVNPSLKDEKDKISHKKF